MLKRYLSLLFLLLMLPASGLCASKISGAVFTPKNHAVAFTFTAPEQDYVQLVYKSSRESGSILVKGDNSVFAGEISLPLTYAGNNVSITFRSMSGSKMGDAKTRTEYPTAPPAAQPNPTGPLSGITVCIDPGHQLTFCGGIEPIGPGLSGNKAIVFGMAEGIVTKRKEAAVVLEVGLQLRDLLLQRGAKVVMTRDVMDKTLSNLERADIANSAEADITLRLHGNAIRNHARKGIVVYGPLHSDYAKALADIATYQAWGQALLDSMLKTTGAQRGGAGLTDQYVGSNWCKMPVFLVEMGFMTNIQDDLLLSDPDYQQKLCQGMADGIEAIMRMRGLIQ